MKYPALFEPAEEGGFIVTFPDVEGALSQGDDEQDAREMAEDALVTMIAHCIRQGKPVDLPTQPRGRKYRMIELPAMVSLKTELYVAFPASGIRKAELARRLKIPKTTVDRLFDFDNHTRLDKIEAAFAALGKRIDFEVRDAAR
jgi:antitoxin HicB